MGYKDVLIPRVCFPAAFWPLFVYVLQLLDAGELYHYHGKVLLKEPEIGGKFEWHQDYG